MDSGGNVYVADTNNNRIQKFTSNGTFTTALGSRGSGNGQFFSPRGVAVDSGGNVYVVDSGNSRIQQFTSNGTFTTAFGTRGSLNGQFVAPNGVAVDSGGDVYVADTNNNRVQVFTPNATAVPEPTSTLGLLLLGGMGVASRFKKQKNG